MSTTNNAPGDALDVWFRFDDDSDEATCEANVYCNDDGTYRVEWYHNAVGLVGTQDGFPTHEAAQRWLEDEGFEDFTVEND